MMCFPVSEWSLPSECSGMPHYSRGFHSLIFHVAPSGTQSVSAALLGHEGHVLMAECSISHLHYACCYHPPCATERSSHSPARLDFFWMFFLFCFSEDVAV